jgi:hypothetical protein
VIAKSKQDLTTGLKDTRNAGIKVKDQAAQTVTSLERLVDPNQTDLHAAYDSFSKAVASLDSEATSMKSVAAKTRSDGQKFFSYWENDLASYTNEDVREGSEKRRKEALEEFTESESDLDKALGSLQELQTLAGDTKIYLGNTLSPEGVEHMSDVAKEASKKSEKLGELIDSANQKMDRVIQELSS